MDADSMWVLFEKTGNIVFYLLYSALKENADPDETADRTA